LLRVYGDSCLGIYAEVVEGGEVRTGDRLELLD
jgi:MOSC domain-containing protein YiiM